MPAMYAFLLLFPTYYGGVHAFYLLPLIFAIFTNSGMLIITRKEKLALSILGITTGLMCINLIIGIAKVQEIFEVMPYFILYFWTFFTAKFIKLPTIRVLVILISIECLFVYLESVIGVNTIFTGHEFYRSDLNDVGLYYSRPFGLSSGQATMAYKIMVGVALLEHYCLFTRRIKIMLRFVLLGALVLTFSRTLIIAVVAYYMVLGLMNSPRKTLIGITASAVSSLFVIIYFYSDAVSLFIEVFNRGEEDGVALSYRDELWMQAKTFILDHPILGNNSFKFTAYLSEYGYSLHLHNSFLQVLSNNGVIIATLHVLFIIIFIRRSNFAPALLFLIYSAGQYGIWWGISIVDIIMIWMLVYAPMELASLSAESHCRLECEKSSRVPQRSAL
jgi:O-antigen ligase